MYCSHRRQNATDDVYCDHLSHGKATPIATLLRETGTIANSHIQLARNSRSPNGDDTIDDCSPRPDGVGIRNLHHHRQHGPNKKPGTHQSPSKRHRILQNQSYHQQQQHKPQPQQVPNLATSAVASSRPIMNRQEYHERLAIAEALSRTSMMTSPAARRRLAARKVEFDMMGGVDEGYWDDDFDYVPPKQLLLYMVR